MTSNSYYNNMGDSYTRGHLITNYAKLTHNNQLRLVSHL